MSPREVIRHEDGTIEEHEDAAYALARRSYWPVVGATAAALVMGALSFHSGAFPVMVGGGAGGSASAGALSEPTFNAATDSLILSDSLDQWASITEIIDSLNAPGDPALGLWPRCIALQGGWPDCDTVPDFVDGDGYYQLVDKGGGDMAMRIAYADNGGQDSREWRTYPTVDTSAASRMMNIVTINFEVTALTAPDTVYPNDWSIKHVMLWHLTNGRIQLQPHNLNAGTCPSRPQNRATWWRVEDNNGVSGCAGTTPDSMSTLNPLDLLAAGSVRMTIQYQSPTATPGYDGCLRAWWNGELFIDVSASSLLQTPTGDNVWRSWSDSADHEDMNTNTGVSFLSFGGPRTAGDNWQSTYDISTLDWWIRPNTTCA